MRYDVDLWKALHEVVTDLAVDLRESAHRCGDAYLATGLYRNG
jgi:hypothetical protein